MAAVAAEPGAAAAGASTTAAGDGLVYAAEPGEHVADLEPEPTAVFAPEMEVCGQQAESADAAEECSQVQVEMSRPEVRVAGKPECVQTQDGPTDTDTATATADEHMLTDSTQTHTEAAEERLKEPFSFNQVSPHESGSSVRFLPPSTGSDPAAPAAEEPDTGLYLTEPTPEPSHDNLESVPELERDLLVSSPRSNSEPEAATIAPDSIFNPPVDAFHESSDPPESEVSLGESVAQSCTSDSSKDSEPAEPLTSSEPEDTHVHAHGSRLTDGLADTQISEQKVQQGCAEPADSQLEPIHGLVPGSEVRVSLDHIIDDALVVSFHLGEKIFSGVLMDVSKRFGPYGIPITVFPKREYKDKPESMQLKAEPFQSEKGIIQETPDVLSKDVAQGSSEAQANPKPEPNPWTSKPPPLFQEGAAYPPPLFIRDTYSQSLPQPPPRKIKRPKRRLYREEPTSIMNAIKLRPRQVLCDKCKEAVVQGDKRETRRGPISDCQRDDAKRRRNNSAATTAGKRPRSDARSEDRSRSVDAPKRQTAAIRVTSSSTSTALGQVKGAAAGNRIIKGVSSTALSSANSSSRVQLNAKKVLQSKNVDHSKAREVLKMAKAQKRQRETVGGSSGNNKGRTRATALQEAHQKVHHTRRLQQISVGGPTLSNPLPPRMRIKPQRYRNEENDSSSCKPPCLEKVVGGGRLALPKLATSRSSSTRSSYSSSCPAGQATASAESQGPDTALEPQLRQPRPKPQLQPQTAPEQSNSQPEPEEQEGQEMSGSKAGNLVVYMTLNPSQLDSSSTSMCSLDSADDLKSSNSECSSTETLDFPPPGDFRSATAPGTSSTFASASPTAPKQEKKRSKSLKAAVFSKNVSKCVALNGSTICVGDIVWAKILGFPWWPARILTITISRKDNGLLVRQEARVSWFGSPTTSFLAITQLSPFLENFQSRFDKKRKGLYRKAITEAAKAAKQLTPEVRALLTQFET